MIGNMHKQAVVTVFLRHNDRILLLRRSEKAATYQGFWSGISCNLNNGEDAFNRALQGIAKETGLSKEQVTLVCDSTPLDVPAPEFEACWVVHAYLFDIQDPQAITLDSDNLELLWVRPEQVINYHTVPALMKVLGRCLEHERSMALA
jgi:ADP-ribose pyrophosphatase YjhB (NUDIX family)